MREISALEISVLVRELQAFSGFYIDKFYEIGEGRFRVRLSKRGEDKADLILAIKCGVWKASEIEAAEKPSNFAIAARKRISGFSIKSIGQLADDRIMEFKLSKGEENASLILEMQGKGNLILADKERKITLAYTQEDFRDRSVRVGEAYSLPKNTFVKYDGMEELAERAASAEKEMTIISFLSRNINVGSLYLEDSLRKMGINPRAKMQSLGPNDMADAISSMQTEIRLADKGDCILYLDNGAPKDYALCEIEKYSTLKQERCALQQALEKFYVISEGPQESEEERELAASIQKQREIIKEIDVQIESNKAVAETVFRRMGAINKMIDEARKNKRITEEEMNDMFNEIETLEVDLKKKSFTIEID